METAMEIVPSSSEHLDLETICRYISTSVYISSIRIFKTMPSFETNDWVLFVRSRTRELENMLDNWNEGASESENFLGDCALNFKVLRELFCIFTSDIMIIFICVRVLKTLCAKCAEKS